jgi:hypothetical protein
MGGIFDGSTTMVGISGAWQDRPQRATAAEGAQKQGKRGLLVTLDEHPAQILQSRLLTSICVSRSTPALSSPLRLPTGVGHRRPLIVIRTIEAFQIERLVATPTSYSLRRTSAVPRLFMRWWVSKHR